MSSYTSVPHMPASRAQELCESGGGRPGLPSLINLRLLWTESNTSSCVQEGEEEEDGVAGGRGGGRRASEGSMPLISRINHKKENPFGRRSHCGGVMAKTRTSAPPSSPLPALFRWRGKGTDFYYHWVTHTHTHTHTHTRTHARTHLSLIHISEPTRQS